MISTIYLIRLAVSRADNKKEEPQKFVCENCTNLESKPIGKECDKSVKQGSETQTEVRGSEHVDTNSENKSSMPTPQQSPLTLGTAIPQNNNAPPPSFQNSSTQPSSTGLFAEMGNVTLKKTNPPVSESGSGKKCNSNSTDSRGAFLAEIQKGKKLISREERDKREKERLNKLEDVQPKDLMDVFSKALQSRFKANYSSDSDDNDNDQNRTPNSEWEDEHQTPPDHQSDCRERSGSPDSDYGSGSKLTSPSNPVPKAGKPPVPPKPANLKTGPQAPSVTTVTNEAGKLPASSVKERCGMFGGADTKSKRGSVLVR